MVSQSVFAVSFSHTHLGL